MTEEQDVYLATPNGNVADGVWVVIVADGHRHEIPIELPHVMPDDIADRIRSLNGKALWAKALAGGDALTDPDCGPAESELDSRVRWKNLHSLKKL